MMPELSPGMRVLAGRFAFCVVALLFIAFGAIAMHGVIGAVMDVVRGRRHFNWADWFLAACLTGAAIVLFGAAVVFARAGLS